MITLGTDPELLLVNQEGEFASVAGLIGGTKGCPIPIPHLRDYGMQEDNVMLEFNTPPSTSSMVFSQGITTAMNELSGLVRTKGLLVSEYSEGIYPRSALRSRQAQQFGCSADFSAYEQGKACPRVSPSSLQCDDGAWRFAGGHIHLGYKDDLQFNVPEHVVAAFTDVIVGLPLVSSDTQDKRRPHYGTAGRFRPKAYGLEYRTLSNFWVHRERTANLVGDAAFRVMNWVTKRRESDVRKAYNEVPWHDVQAAINLGNADLADDLYDYIIGETPLGGAVI